MMKRSMFQVYVKNSVAAAEFYKEAFDAEILCEYKDENGNYLHAELSVFGQVLSMSEAREDSVTGNTMQLCLHMGEGREAAVERAYNVLGESAVIDYPLGPCMFSPYMFGLIDKFGVSWCVFV